MLAEGDGHGPVEGILQSGIVAPKQVSVHRLVALMIPLYIFSAAIFWIAGGTQIRLIHDTWSSARLHPGFVHGLVMYPVVGSCRLYSMVMS
ncbi:MAG: hypothetical protein H3C37_09945 [Candidatus Kapabacteria bacterium]|nr:hypothetical protein [Candidatus Kapabacteria bacterium]